MPLDSRILADGTTEIAMGHGYTVRVSATRFDESRCNEVCGCDRYQPAARHCIECGGAALYASSPAGDLEVMPGDDAVTRCATCRLTLHDRCAKVEPYWEPFGPHRDPRPLCTHCFAAEALVSESYADFLARDREATARQAELDAMRALDLPAEPTTINPTLGEGIVAKVNADAVFAAGAIVASNGASGMQRLGQISAPAPLLGNR